MRTTSRRGGRKLTRRALGRRALAAAGLAAVPPLAGCATPEIGPPVARALPDARPGLAPSYDYIVVGSGAGGGPLAANLARAGRRVLLIEAGAADAGGLKYSVPVFHAASTEEPSMQWDYFVRHWDRPPARDSKAVPGKGIWYPRAGTLGGCTAHNAMITIYPDEDDWNRIAAANSDPGWSADRMRGYFRRLERCTYRPQWKDTLAESGHGYAGWLPTATADPKLLLADRDLIRIVLAAAGESGIPGLAEQVFNGLLDPNDVRSNAHGREGLYLTPLAVGDGMRYGTRDRLIATQQAFPDRLTILTGALVTRVLLDGDRAVGVEYLDEAHAYAADPAAARGRAPLRGRLKQVKADREVIVAAGAFNSPQLLMLSGIGPRAELARHGIATRIERRGVGQNLQDRYEVGVITRYPRPFALLAGNTVSPPVPGQPMDPAMQRWMRGRDGVYATNGVVVGIARKSRPERPLPDLFIFGFPGAFRGYYPGYSRDAVRPDHFTWAILKAHTRNTHGQVRLRSADPRDTPDIAFRYFEEGNDAAGEDLDSVVEGVNFVREMNRRLGPLDGTEQVPGPAVQTRAQIADFVRREAWGHHASCSNKMGPASDPLAVVDSRFRVHGVRGLRVVDASVFANIPGLFICTAVYMISEKASDDILAETHPLPSGEGGA